MGKWKEPAKGWTHPSHWKVIAVGTLCQIGAAVLVGLAIVFVPFFADRRAEPGAMMYKLLDDKISCQKTYCYDTSGENTADPGVQPGQTREHVLQIEDKPDEKWLQVARILLLAGGATNLLSLVLLLLVFWPVVFVGKVLNIVLFLCRIIDFFGAPLKFVGSFFFIWYIPDVNYSYSWWRYDGLLQLDPLPVGLVLFSYILQTLCFVCATLAMDLGAKGHESHTVILKHQNLLESLEMEAAKTFERVSYHPIDTSRSSKILNEVAEHMSRASGLRESESHV